MVDMRDARVTPVAELARTIGYVFQSPSQMLFARTVREELLFGPRNLGLPMDDPDAVAMDALRRTGLAAEEGISPPAMSGHVDRLERAGFLERVRSTEDRRRVGLRLTDNGERLMRRVRARRTTWLADRLRQSISRFAVSRTREFAVPAPAAIRAGQSAE